MKRGIRYGLSNKTIEEISIEVMLIESKVQLEKERIWEKLLCTKEEKA